MSLKPFDFIIICLVAIFITYYSIDTLKSPIVSSQFYIEIDGEKLLYPKNSNEIITIVGPIGKTVIKIEDNCASVIESECRDQICVQMGKVCKHGQIAACLPNRLIIGIEEESEGVKEEVDAVTY